MTTTLHAHVSTASADCDGPMYRDYVTSLNDVELLMHEKANGVNDFHDLEFKSRVLSNHVSFHSEFGVQASITEGGFTMHEQTDEGYRSAEVYWCEDAECDPNSYSQRDVFAEQMNY
jgi:hypothetical protein